MNKLFLVSVIICIICSLSANGQTWPSTSDLNIAFDADLYTLKSGRPLLDRFNLGSRAREFVVDVGDDPSRPLEMVVSTPFQEWSGMVVNSSRSGDVILNTTWFRDLPIIQVPLRTSTIVRWNVTATVAGLQERRLATALVDFDVVYLLRVVNSTFVGDYTTYAPYGRVNSLIYGQTVSNSSYCGHIPDTWWQKAEQDNFSAWYQLQGEISSLFYSNVKTQWTQLSQLFNDSG